ncbi:MAG: ABC transporter ATP-binding protein [Gemmatimonadetes bacterium]|nr:ABC transporter ATP-binding protein [Gemmatimonadota bacterium]
MIDVEGLTKSYRKGTMVTEVLKGVTFRVSQGEFVAIMGPSGSGKSTLLNILGLLDQPDAGRYRLEGADLSGADDDTLSAARNRKIGFVFQQFHLLERASALRNVTLPLLYAESDSDDGTARAERALEAVGLSQRAHHLPSELSGGEQQRVAIARALINDPAVILADEPTGNLDARSGAEILDTFRRLADAGRTIVLVTHDRGVAERADRILVLEDGRITADETVGRPSRGSAARDGAAAVGPA